MNIEQIKQAVYEAITKALKTYTPQQLEVSLGISSAYISQLKNKKADGMGDKRWIALYNNPVLGIVRQEIIETPNYSQMVRIASDCIKEGSKKMVYGRTGFGKTTVLNHIMNSGVLGGNCFYMLCDVMMNRKSFIADLATAMGIKTQEKKHNKLKDRTTRAIFIDILDKLMNIDNALLLFDDAGKLGAACHRVIQIIEDKTKGMVGIMLTSTDQYYYEKLLKMNHGEIKSWIGFPEYWSRFSFVQKLHGPSANDVKEMCIKAGIGEEYEKVLNTILKIYGDKDEKRGVKESENQYNKRVSQAKWSSNPAENEVDYRQISSIISSILKLINSQKGQQANEKNNG